MLIKQDHDVISPLVDTDFNNDGAQDVVSPVVLNGGAGKASGNFCGRGSQNPIVASAADRGREMHKNFNFGAGYEKEVVLPSGKRADAVNWMMKDVVELKPDNPKAIRRGIKQVENYRQELESITGDCWSCRVVTYK